MMTKSIMSQCLTQMQTQKRSSRVNDLDWRDGYFSRHSASIFCQFSPGCSDGEWQLPNSITNYQQHFTIIRGNKSKHRELRSHPPLTVTKTPGRVKLFCQRKMLINHILTPGSRPVLDLANHQFGIFAERKFWWFSVSIVDNLRHLKKAKLALSHNQSQVFTRNLKMQLHW